MIDNKGNGGILLILGIGLLVVGIFVALGTGVWEVNRAKEPPQNPDVVYIFSWAIIGYAVAVILIFFGVLLIIFGLKG